MDVSIIIPWKGEEDCLNTTLESLYKAKNTVDYEIVIVSNFNQGKSYPVLDLKKERNVDIRVISGDNLSIGQARNLGATYARGDYLFFGDDHLMFSDYSLDNLVINLQLSNGNCITPAIEDTATGIIGYGGTFNKSLDYIWISKSLLPIEEVLLAPGYGILMKKSFFEELGGFNESFLKYGVEDYEFSLRLWFLGYRLVVDSETILKHSPIVDNLYKVSHSELIYNYLTLGYLLFDEDSFSRVLELFRTNHHFNNALSLLMEGNSLMEDRKNNIQYKTIEDKKLFDKFLVIF